MTALTATNASASTTTTTSTASAPLNTTSTAAERMRPLLEELIRDVQEVERLAQALGPEHERSDADGEEDMYENGNDDDGDADPFVHQLDDDDDDSTQDDDDDTDAFVRQLYDADPMHDEPAGGVRRLDHIMDLLHAQYAGNQDSLPVQDREEDGMPSDSTEEETDDASSDADDQRSTCDEESGCEESSDTDNGPDSDHDDRSDFDPNINVMHHNGYRARRIHSFDEWLAPHQLNGQGDRQATPSDEKERRLSTEATRLAFQRYLRRISAIQFSSQLL